MDEIIDILDAEGNFTKQPCLKSKAHQLGLTHASIQIWFYTSTGKILLQQRIKTKETHPGLWDVSVAGHISFGETPLSAVVRESEEELGIILDEKKIVFIQKYRQKDIHPNGIIDDEFNFVYGYLLSENQKFTLQKNEVTAVKWLKITEFKKAIKEKKSDFVPRKKDYYSPIFEHLKMIPIF